MGRFSSEKKTARDALAKPLHRSTSRRDSLRLSPLISETFPGKVDLEDCFPFETQCELQ